MLHCGDRVVPWGVTVFYSSVTVLHCGFNAFHIDVMSRLLSTSKNDATTSPSNSSLLSPHLSSFSSSVPFPS
jgi:hypothetical protein